MAQPIYTPRNCNAAYQLNWSLAVFWNAISPSDRDWLEPLRKATEADGVHLLEHRLTDKNASQFLISTRPETAPPAAVRSVKGRLQYLVKDTLPKAFRRNYGLWSVGTVNWGVIQRYIAEQTRHHRMADPRVQRRFESLSIAGDGDALEEARLSGHAQYCYNLHLVLVSRDRGIEVRSEVLEARREMIVAVARKKGHILGKGQIVADHLHVALGCPLVESPQDVALAYMNNLAYAEGMKPIFQYGYYAGTFSRYDLDAIRQKLREG